jgi:hypothetical protein
MTNYEVIMGKSAAGYKYITLPENDMWPSVLHLQGLKLEMAANSCY